MGRYDRALAKALKGDSVDLADEIFKSHVKAHVRLNTKTGKEEFVRDYEDARMKHVVAQPMKRMKSAQPDTGKQRNLEHGPPAKPALRHGPPARSAPSSGESLQGQKWPTLTVDANKAWHTEDGKEVSADDHKRLQGVPPGWTNVMLNPDQNGALQVKGTDSKGRTQYVYSAAHSEKAAAEKFARLKDFNKALPAIQQAVDRDMLDDGLSPAQRDTAACLRLISKTGFRVGSDKDTGAEKKAYGASNLQADHIKISGDRVEFNFVGKKGVQQNHVVEDKALAQYLAPRKKAGGRLFDTDDGKIRDYLKYVSRENFKVKDFRTWNATAKALTVINGHTIPSDDKGFKKFQLSVAKEVSTHLGNTPAMALQAYIDPAVWRRWG